MHSLQALVIGIAAALACLVSGCSPKVQIDVGLGAERHLAPSTVLVDPGAGDETVAMIDVRGLLADSQRFDLLGRGVNPVDRFVTQLALAEKDANVRAIIIRITSPGGTVTASDRKSVV